MIIGPFGALFGSACSGYTSTFGPMSGNRTLVTARYTMGWWPSRLCVLLNIVIMLGYGLVDILAAGQILSAVNGAGLSHVYERYAWMPQLAALFILAGVAEPDFNASTVTDGAEEEVAADRMSYFWLCAASTIAWSPATADFYVYFLPNTSRWMTWLCKTVGITMSVSISILFDAGLGSGLLSKKSWSDAYDVSMGALIVELTLVEEFLFRRRRDGYDWTAWNDPKRLPIGLAALAAFLIGWVGAVLGMWQTYFTGPLAKLVGEGIDMGMPVGATWAVLVFVPLSWLELKYVGR
ncbi:hypothetical protein NKR19_g5385 [Coniochaeta hoffmannii]|uniref:Purine-cytosine permease FCY21 n=1 Tax=Coniochaeta hoffmannii TaxID=91930 RepID=A0AA38RI36_9PEZI|nr:hypothetical protein NKR19_g5385 [Coniochaeta hoffmannii]